MGSPERRREAASLPASLPPFPFAPAERREPGPGFVRAATPRRARPPAAQSSPWGRGLASRSPQQAPGVPFVFQPSAPSPLASRVWQRKSVKLTFPSQEIRALRKEWEGS